MSGYIAELRRELVDAAERERRRSAPRRALARSRRPLATGLAGAATGLAALLGIAALGRDDPEPVAAPRIVATIAIGGLPQDVAVGAGAVWVADGTGRVVRIDPETRDVVAKVPAGSEVPSVATSEDAVWATALVPGGTDHDTYQLLRIDPESNDVVARIGPAPELGLELAATPTTVWVQGYEGSPAPVARVDASTGVLGPGFKARRMAALEVHDDVLWALSVTGVLERRDAGSGRLLGRLRGFAGGDYRSSIAPDEDGAWIASAGDGMLTRVSSDMRVTAQRKLGAIGPVVIAGPSLWFTAGDVYDRNAELVRIDRETGAVTGRLPLGSRIPSSLVAVGDDVWAALTDGTVRVVR